jgi:hypothetical protein
MGRLTACSVAAVLVLVTQTVQGQSLGDVARQEEQRRKAVQSSGKVYTNDNLRPEPPPSAAPALPPPTADPSQHHQGGRPRRPEVLLLRPRPSRTRHIGASALPKRDRL